MITPTSPAGSATRPARTVMRASTRGVVPQPPQPASKAAARIFAMSLLLGVLGLVSAVVVIARLFESWRVAPGPASHGISLFGQRMSYPAANTGAIIITALAGLGLLMVAAAARRAMRELRADREFRRTMAAGSRPRRDGAWVIDDER